MKIGKLEISHGFQLADIGGKVLLGMDFFKKHKCVLDINNCNIKIRTESLDCCDQYGTPLSVRVIADKEVIIPPQCEIVTGFQLSRPIQHDQTTGWVEPTHKILVLRLLNGTGEEIVIRKHTTLGRFSPVEVEDGGAQGADVAFNLCQRGSDRQL